MLVAPERFSDSVRDELLEPGNELLLSAASTWEISIKYALGKLPLPVPPTTYVPSRMKSSGTTGLPIEHVHALHVSTLPDHHRDPFDRLLIAQAQVEKLTVLSADRQFERYQIDLRRP